MRGPAVQLASTPTDRDISRVITAQMKQDWTYELKFDGIRAVVSRDASGVVTVFNRRQLDITYRYPDVVAAITTMGFIGVLDGEIIVSGADGRPDFAAVHHRDAQGSPRAAARLAVTSPAQFMAFDALEDRGEDLRAQRQIARRSHLVAMCPSAPVESHDGDLMWAFVLEHRLEGLIAKNPDAPYRAGRHSSWVKLKLVHRVHALVAGTTVGKGSRAIGALRLYVLADGEPVGIGSVGSGMSDRDQQVIAERLAAGGPLVVEVEYLEVSAGGSLRMPVFIGFSNVDPASCTLDTLK